MSPLIGVGETCGLGCGRPVWKDGYCAQCWHLENLKGGGGPIPIFPKPAWRAPTVAADIPDTFPEAWTRE